MTAVTGKTTYETSGDREFRMTRVVDAPRALVFDAWTNPKHLPQWLLGPEGWTMPVCEIDFRVGGAWRMVWDRTGGTEMTLVGKYLEIVAPERVVTAESWGPEWPQTINRVAFTEAGGQTTITLTLTYPSPEAREAALATGMKGGMDVSFARFDRLLAKLGEAR
jgi:uncharacterized protein YndB with AHSA1/START domain